LGSHHQWQHLVLVFTEKNKGMNDGLNKSIKQFIQHQPALCGKLDFIVARSNSTREFQYRKSSILSPIPEIENTCFGSRHQTIVAAVAVLVVGVVIVDIVVGVAVAFGDRGINKGMPKTKMSSWDSTAPAVGGADRMRHHRRCCRNTYFPIQINTSVNKAAQVTMRNLCRLSSSHVDA